MYYYGLSDDSMGPVDMGAPQRNLFITQLCLEGRGLNQIFSHCWPRLRQRKMKPRGKSPPRKPGVTCLPLAIVSESCLRFCSWSECMPFGLAIWGQFVLWVALPGVSAATIGKDGESTGRRGLQQKKTGLMESLFGAKSHTQRQLIWRGVLGGQAGMNSNSPRPNSAILNYWWISSPPRFDWGKAALQAIRATL